MSIRYDLSAVEFKQVVKFGNTAPVPSAARSTVDPLGGALCLSPLLFRFPAKEGVSLIRKRAFQNLRGSFPSEVRIWLARSFWYI